MSNETVESLRAELETERYEHRATIVQRDRQHERAAKTEADLVRVTAERDAASQRARGARAAAQDRRREAASLRAEVERLRRGLSTASEEISLSEWARVKPLVDAALASSPAPAAGVNGMVGCFNPLHAVGFHPSGNCKPPAPAVPEAPKSCGRCGGPLEWNSPVAGYWTHAKRSDGRDHDAVVPGGKFTPPAAPEAKTPERCGTTFDGDRLSGGGK